MTPDGVRLPAVLAASLAALSILSGCVVARPGPRDDCVTPEQNLEEIFQSAAQHPDVGSASRLGRNRDINRNAGTLYDEACEVLEIGFDNEGSRALPWRMALAKMPSAAAAAERFKTPPGEAPMFDYAEPGRYLDTKSVATTGASWDAHYLADCLLVSIRWSPEEVSGTDAVDRDQLVRELLTELPDFCADVPLPPLSLYLSEGSTVS